MPGFDLTDRVAIVTGGAQGLGLGIARQLAKAGAHIAIAARLPEPVRGRGYQRPHVPVEPAVQEIKALGRRALGVTVDVRDAGQVARMVQETLTALGRIDILVNNAGGAWGESFNVGPLLEITDEDLMETFRLNVKASFLCSQAVVPVMKRHGKGAIINIASTSALGPSPGYASYGASKAALIHLTQTMAQEWAPEVRVNVVAPGNVVTPHRVRGGGTRDGQEALQRRLGSVALDRSGDPEEFGAAVVFLASDAGSYTTGACIAVDGGRMH
jgi:NAD(P)-dependent dehydrogenase (short-subunit alcohol dehydrogenase family)